MSEKYCLEISEIEQSVKEFASTNGEVTYKLSSQDDTGGRYDFFFNGEKRFSSMINYYISCGQVSFSCGGKNKRFAEDCKNKIIKDCCKSLQERSSFTIKAFEKTSMELLKSYFTDELKFEVEEKDNDKNDKIETELYVTGHYRDTLKITLYKSKTLLAQGKRTLVFMEFIDFVYEFLTDEEVKDEFYEYWGYENGMIGGEDLISEYIPEAKKFINKKNILTITPSLQIINKDLGVTDYSLYTFPILKGVEGILRDIINEVDKDFYNERTFKKYFSSYDNYTKFRWVDDRAKLFSPLDYSKKILNLYGFYYLKRHTIFHVDATISNIVLLDYSQARQIIIDALELINNVYKHKK